MAHVRYDLEKDFMLGQKLEMIIEEPMELIETASYNDLSIAM